MKTLARTLLVWFVLLAIPFQGFAAAAMTCAHGMAPVAAGPAVAPLASAPLASAPAAKPPCHGEAAELATQSASVHDTAGGDDQPHQKKCGNCSACSVGAAMAPASSPCPADCCPCSCCQAAAPARVAVADPDLPERPPRTLLA